MSKIFDQLRHHDHAHPVLGFGGNRIKSHVESRSEHCLSAALDNNTTRYLVVHEGHALYKIPSNPDEGVQLLLHSSEVNEFELDYAGAIFLGELEDIPVVAVKTELDPENMPDGWALMDTRTVMVASDHYEAQAGAYAMAISLMNWHQSNQYCGRCGHKNAAHIGGMRRDCDHCGAQVFPRTDPAVIMLAVREDQCLLGRSPHFPEHWYSCLAGFVEPGETIEQAVRRETREESGLRIGHVKYHASQPWPFPHSIMIGCYCEALSEKISFDTDELEDCRWFSKEEVVSMIEKRHAKELRAPPSKSIAAHLIRNWIEVS